MNRFLNISRIMVVMFFFVFAFFITAPKTHAAAPDWQKAVSVYPHSPSDFSSDSFKRTVQKLKDMGANTVTLVIPLYQSTESSSDIGPGGDTPSDASLIDAAKYLQAQGLNAVFKPHLEYGNVTGWRANIRAKDRDSWYANYGAMLNRLGDIGSQNGVDGIIMGTELIAMASEYENKDNTVRWTALANDLRTHFSGWLSYDANWSWGNPQFEHEIESIGFWPALDFIGVSAYYPLAQDVTNPTVEQIKQSWKYWDDTQLRRIHEKFGKDIVFSEIGYKSSKDANKAPCCTWTESYDPDIQSKLYDGLFSYWKDVPYMKGVHLWYFDVEPEYGGEGNTDYTALEKPAYDVIKSSFGGPNTFVPNEDEENNNATSTPDVIDTSDVENNIDDVSTSTPNDVNSTSTNSGGNISTSTDSDNTNVNQPVIEDVNNSTSTSNLPNATSSNDVSNETNSSSNTGAIEVTDLDIWWPTNGVVVSGIQPLKVMIENVNVADYDLFWQVDGDRLNPMYDSAVDYPHKEAIIDLTMWTWNGEGPYKLNFIVKDKTGNTLKEQNVNIYVVQL